MSSTYCQSIKKIEIEIWELLKKCVAVGHQLAEETITDLILLWTKELEPSICIHQYNKRTERYSGGDWEYWFTDSSGRWIGIRIQAKVIRLKTSRFEHLKYEYDILDIHGNKTGRKETQTEVLIKSCRAAAKKPYPLYCLYTYWADPSITVSPTCSKFVSDNRFFGYSIIDAHRVVQLNSARLNSLNDVSPFIRPFHCIVCCSGNFPTKQGTAISNPVTPVDIIQLFLTDILNFGDSKTMNVDSAFGDIVYNTPPDHVKQILNNKNEIELETADEYLNGVVIINLQDE